MGVFVEHLNLSKVQEFGFEGLGEALRKVVRRGLTHYKKIIMDCKKMMLRVVSYQGG